MKRRFALILAACLVLGAALGACGASGVTDRDNSASSDSYWGADSAPAPEPMPEPELSSPAEAPGSWNADGWNDVVESAGGGMQKSTSLSEKIIYSADVSVETTDFDTAVGTLEDMLDLYGAFVESSSVSGRSISARRTSYRTARYTIRVPVEKFMDMRDGLGNVGSVLSVYTYTDNITEQYYDTQSRADSYRIEQERLMDMLGKCETVSDMIEVESRLSEVRYQLESLESTLRNWQNEVDYSTIDVTISEVEEYTEIVEPHRSFWQQVGDGLRNTFRGIGDFFKGLFKWFIVSLPVIVLVAAVIALAVLAVTVPVRRRRKREKEEKRDRTDE